MFPFLVSQLTKIKAKKCINFINNNFIGKTGEKMQDLIDLLSKDVLTMNLSHISGEAIAKKDRKHLINFL
jgi:hypothetical protein